jgi:polar amino acid transport system substrate-binding protein
MLLYATKPYLSKCKTMSLVELLKDGFRLGVQENVVFGSIMRQIQADPELNSRLIYIENDSPHAELVKLKNLDGIIDDPVVVAYRSTINDTGKFLNACPITISSSPVRLMFSKKSVPESIVERFNQAIIQVKTSKEYKKHWDW